VLGPWLPARGAQLGVCVRTMPHGSRHAGRQVGVTAAPAGRRLGQSDACLQPACQASGAARLALRGSRRGGGGGGERRLERGPRLFQSGRAAGAAGCSPQVPQGGSVAPSWAGGSARRPAGDARAAGCCGHAPCIVRPAAAGPGLSVQRRKGRGEPGRSYPVHKAAPSGRPPSASAAAHRHSQDFQVGLGYDLAAAEDAPRLHQG
jgi:hypothetical protein